MGDPTSIITAGSGLVTQFAFDNLKKQINYVFNYNENLERFKDLHKKLEIQQKEVEDRVREAENKNNEEPTESATTWLNDAKEKLNSETNAELLREKNERVVAEKCCFGYVEWNPKYRHNLSRRAVKKAEDIDKVLKEMKDRGSTPLTRSTGPPSLGSVQGKFIHGLKSRQEAVDRIMDVLRKNNGVNRIGVYGMGGAGKSTIVKEIARRAEKEKIFQNVLSAEVSQSPNTKNIQQCLAERIDFSLDKCHNENERALKLNAAIKNKLRRHDQTKTSMELNKDEASGQKLIGHDQTKTSMELNKDEASGQKLIGRDQTMTSMESRKDEASAIQEAHGWIEDLRSSSLLEVDYDNGEIKIHDEVRAIGILIASKEKGKFYVGACSSWLSEKIIKDCSIISMMPSESYEYFNNLNMPELQLLRMHKATLSNLTCTSFENIKVLDLSESTIEELPSSIEVIRDLRTLILNKCSILKDITQVCVLLKLQILSLNESNVESLPKEIGNLVKLKVLDLTSCKMIKEISAGTLASLTQLEALLMRDSFDGWQSKETVASIHELKALPLKVLEIDVKSMKQLPLDKEYKIPTLLFFGIRVGCVLDTSSSTYNVLSSPRLFIKGANACDLFKEVLIDLPKRVTNLYLENIVGLKRVVATPDEGRLENESEVGKVCCGQKDCLIKAKTIREWGMSSFQDGFCVIDKFQHLQEVRLVDMAELELYALRPQNSKKLKKIIIDGCKKLKYIFSGCKGNQKDYIELPALEELMLTNLPSLEGFCYGTDAINRSPSLFTKKVKLPVLKILFLDRISKLKYVWDDEFCPAACEMINMTELNICDCSSLESVCTISAVKGLRNLHILNIKDCEYMREVISTEVGRKNGSTPNEILIFSELSILKLSGLSNLTCFFQGSTKIEFPSLRLLTITDIKNIQSFVKQHYSNNEEEADNQPSKILFSSKQLVFPSLIWLELRGIQDIEILWDKATSNELPKLETILMKEMPKLRCISSEASDDQLIRGLKNIRLWLCEAVESLISFFHIPPQFHSSNNKIVFSNLQWSKLEGINIYRGDLNVEFPTLRFLGLSKIPLQASLKAEKDNIQTDRSVNEQEEKTGDTQMTLFDNKIKFPSLENLIIGEIPELERLFDCSIEEEDDIAAVGNSTRSTIFPNLTCFRIWRCKSMRYLFSKKLLAGLQNLEELSFFECNSLEELFEVEDEEEQRYTERKIVLLPKLKTLYLKGLPKLKVIPWQILPSLQVLSIYNCFRNNNRKSIIPTTASSDSVMRGGQISLFQNLEELNISWCDDVETVLVGSVGGDQEQSLPAVDDVSVTHYGGSQEDVSPTADQYDHVPVITLPKLQKIKILDMGLLRSFISSAGHVEVHFPSLQSVMFDGCYNMRSFSSMKAVAPKLASIQIDGKEMIEVDGGPDRLNSALLHFDPIKTMEKLWPNTLNHMAHHQHQLIRIFVVAFFFLPKCNECETEFWYGEVAYCCDECRFYICSTCALDRLSDQLVEVPNQLKVSRNWPKSLIHELHAHELQLQITKDDSCGGCKQKIWDVFTYKCPACDFDLHPNCALRPTEKLEEDDKELEVITSSESSVHQIRTDATDSTTSKPSASNVPFSIGGDFVESQSSQFVNVINPATQEVISHVRLATKNDLNVAILVANEAFPLWRDTSITARQKIMIKLHNLILRDMNKLASSITNEQGKVLKDSVRDVLHVLELVGNVYGTKTFQIEEFVSDGFTKPLGVYVGICTTNIPIMISVWMFLLAIAYGNTFILVSSINNSGSSLMFAKLVMEAGVPTGVLNIIYGNDDIINNLCDDDRIHAISFVCSNIGMINRYRKASVKGKRILWDIWAKHYAIVMPDANVDSTLNALVTAGFGVSGKGCMAISSVIFVGDSTKWESKLVELANQLKVNAGTEPDADIGPIINKWEMERTCRLIESSVEAGARLLIDGRGIIVLGYENGNFMGPTILSDVKVHMKCYKNEMFGPVLLCLQAKNLEEAIDIVNHYEHICGASIFTSSDAAAIKFHTEVNAGQVGINVLNPVSIPFTSSVDNKRRYPSTIHS